MTDGRLPRQDEDVATALGLRLSAIRKAINELTEAGIWRVGPDDIEIVDYAEHNPLRADVAAYRKARTEAATKANHSRWHKDKSDPDCPLCVSDSDSDSDTKRNPPRTPDTDSQVENVRTEVTEGSKKNSLGGKSRKRRSQIPDDWTPDDELLAWVREKHPMVDAVAETVRFYDYHRAKGSVMAEWSAAFRNWVRNAEKFAKDRGQNEGRDYKYVN